MALHGPACLPHLGFFQWLVCFSSVSVSSVPLGVYYIASRLEQDCICSGLLQNGRAGGREVRNSYIDNAFVLSHFTLMNLLYNHNSKKGYHEEMLATKFGT